MPFVESWKQYLLVRKAACRRTRERHIPKETEKNETMDREQSTWLVLRTFNRQEMSVADFLNTHGITCFIPMTYKEKYAGEGLKPKRVLVPVIHNYIFIEKSMPIAELKTMLAACRTPLHFMQEKDKNEPVEISNREMLECRLICDPALGLQPTVEDEASQDVEIGKEVEVVHGVLQGVRGRLVRKQKQYWFVKTVAGVSMRVRITRWYCKPI